MSYSDIRIDKDQKIKQWHSQKTNKRFIILIISISKIYSTLLTGNYVFALHFPFVLE